MHEALYYEKKEPGVHCHLCPQHCRLRHGELGLCGVRREEGGKLYTLNYGVCAAMATDPVEKKPLYHFHPGSMIFSLGTLGCNLDCGFCQNWELARGERRAERVSLSPSGVVDMLVRHKGEDTVGVAYTYSEPGMWYEFVQDAAQAVKSAGYKNVLVTNGYLNEKPLMDILPYIDAFNIDVKAFTDEYYREHCRGRLNPVLRYVERAAEKAHVELTYLVVTSLNDSIKEVNKFAEWVASINPSIPVHFSRYYPQHRFRLPPTPVATIELLREAALLKLRYVYTGNVAGNDGSHTYCHSCGKALILRDGYRVRQLFAGGECPSCKTRAEFVL